MNDIFQFLGAAFGILGAILVTSRQRHIRFIAFVVWIISNVFIATAFIKLQAWPLLLMQSFYTITSIIGAINNRPGRTDAA